MISRELLIEPLYSIQIDDTYIGTLAKGALGSLRLCGYHSMAFDGNYSTKNEIIFVTDIF
jgi:hypothetical protein